MFSRTRLLGGTTRLVLAVFSGLALLASFVLSVDKVRLLEDTTTELACSINLVLNCASVMKTDQAQVFFGITNSFFGMVGFAAALALAVVLLAGVKLPCWMMNAMQAAFTLGWLFALWLFFQSVYVIQILCPWCLLVTISTTVLFFAMLRLNLAANNFGLSKSADKQAKQFIVQKYDLVLTIAILVLLAALVFSKFGKALFA